MYINQGYGDTFFDAHRVWQGFAAGYNVTGSNSGTRYAIALGDMDGDGDLDLVSVRYDNVPDRIHFNDGMGHFSDPTNLPTTYQRYAHSVPWVTWMGTATWILWSGRVSPVTAVRT